MKKLFAYLVVGLVILGLASEVAKHNGYTDYSATDVWNDIVDVFENATA